MEHQKHDLDWFTDRIGKTIYRHEDDKDPTMIQLRSEPQARFIFWCQENENKRYFDDGETSKK
jgi:hypothetical protein